MPLRAFAICSDNKVGKVSEDYSISDLAYPATTSTEQLLKEVARATAPGGLTVYFSTYQSIDVVARAQAAGLPDFDLVICDEAHRTAGFTLSGDDQSAFLRVHDDAAIRSDRRLYMTATPKIYAEAVRSQAVEKSAVLVSMDDEKTFGPVFHRLGFGEAVERDLLTDYRVLVLAVDEGSIGSNFQESFAVDGELNIPDAARIVGIYNGLAKRGVEGLGASVTERAPLRRAVAFSRSIKDSQKVQGMLNGYDGELTRPAGVRFVEKGETPGDWAATGNQTDSENSGLRLEAKHVDGTMNVLVRNELLDWLKAETAPDDNVCRILTNARCLSEGVDVPALDAVIFLNSRDSQVDVVQSVGRVMRKVDGKEYGYIILPIAVSAEKTPEQALNDNAKYKVVWDVLRALRAHDERFEAKIEQIDLNRRTDDQIQIIDIRDRTNPNGESSLQNGQKDIPDVHPDGVSVPMDWSEIGADWREAIYAKIVEKVGERDYWENWAHNVSEIAARHQTRITNLVNGSDEKLRARFESFVGGLRDNLNPSISEKDAIEMLSQHLITQPVFDALFEGYGFSKHNPVSLVMQNMVDALEGTRLDTETKELNAFYASVRKSVNGITDAAGKQTTIKRLYEKFFAGAFKSTSERLGIVYTPNEIVDFILHSADEVLRTEFGATLSDEDVHILDPFTGTGTFIVRLLQSGLIRPEDLERKFRNELHANEIVLLAYYVAAVNIEATYHGLLPAGQNSPYEPFPGIVLTDTFQSSEDDDRYDDHGIFGDNNDRVKAQNALDIRVIIGNPPYSAGQDSANDNNQNLKYPSLDGRIAATYVAGSTATLKNKLYDSYVRAFRWASDRVKDKGLVAFVSNGGFIDGNTADGLRKSLADEFSTLYIFNLRGNQRTAGEESRREGGKVFGSGSRATIAISILVKNPDSERRGRVYYRDIGDYLTREEKLSVIKAYIAIRNVPWIEIAPNKSGDWLNQRDMSFAGFRALGDRKDSENSIFRLFSLGVATNRDAWVYGSSQPAVLERVSSTIAYFNKQLLFDGGAASDIPEASVRDISWSRGLIARLKRRSPIIFDQGSIVTAAYRPFQKQYLYADSSILERPGPLTKVYPPAQDNFGFQITAPGSGHPFSVLAVSNVPDLAFWGSGGAQYFPRFSFEQPRASGEFDLFGEPEQHRRIDNITDAILVDYRSAYGQQVTKDDIFYFAYGLMHSVDYKVRFSADLGKMLPRLPKLSEKADFGTFSSAGRELAALHLNYETVDHFPLTEVGTDTHDLRVTKMKFGGKAGAWDKSTVIYNQHITLTGIPAEAQEYMLGSRSAVEWILERYQVKTDKVSGIVNDPNLWGEEHGNPSYILDLLKSIVTVSVETVRIVASLPALVATEGSTAR